MKYLLVYETRMDWNKVKEAVENNCYSFYYLETVQRGRTQIVFPKEDLTLKLAKDIAKTLGMKIKATGKNKVVVQHL